MEDKCICCGARIPEGAWVCPNCANAPANIIRHATKQKAKKSWFGKIFAFGNKSGEENECKTGKK